MTLEYNPSTKGIANFVDSLLQVGVMKRSAAPEYSSEFVKMIKERDREERQTLSVEEQRQLLFG